MSSATAPTLEMSHVTAAPSTSPAAIALGLLLRIGDPCDRAVREPVERLHGEREVLLARVLELRVRKAAQALDEHHHGGHARPGHLGRIVQRTRGEAVRDPGDLAAGLV